MDFATNSEIGAFTLDTFCALFGIGRTKVYSEIKNGRLRAVKCGDKTLILRRDANAWQASLSPMMGEAA